MGDLLPSPCEFAAGARAIASVAKDSSAWGPVARRMRSREPADPQLRWSPFAGPSSDVHRGPVPMQSPCGRSGADPSDRSPCPQPLDASTGHRSDVARLLGERWSRWAPRSLRPHVSWPTSASSGSDSGGRCCLWSYKAGTCPAPPLATASAWEAGALLHLRSWSWSGRGRRSSAGLARSGTTQVCGPASARGARDHAPARRGVGEPRPGEPAGALGVLWDVGS